MHTNPFTFPATEHATMREAVSAVRETNARRAILLGRAYYTVEKTEVERLEIAGVEFAYLSFHVPTGRIMSIPVNDR